MKQTILKQVIFSTYFLRYHRTQDLDQSQLTLV